MLSIQRVELGSRWSKALLALYLYLTRLVFLQREQTQDPSPDHTMCLEVLPERFGLVSANFLCEAIHVHRLPSSTLFG